MRFTAPSDGEYFVRITDHLGKGGPDFVYRVEFQPVQPSLALGIPRVEQYGQYRQTVFVPQGKSFWGPDQREPQQFRGRLDSGGR